MNEKFAIADNNDEYLGKTIEQWNECWKYLPEGFAVLQSDLRRSVGLWAAKVGQDFLYIASASQINNGGLREGLARVRLKPQSVNNTNSLMAIKEWPVSVEAYVLVLAESKIPTDIITKIRDKMIEVHKPKLNVPDGIVKKSIMRSYRQK